MNRNRTGNVKHWQLIVSVSLLVLLLGCLIVLTRTLNSMIRANLIFDTGEKVEAVITSYKYFGSSNKGGYYNLYYTYIDEYGNEYKGLTGIHISRQDEAERALGKTVPIFIDGHGGSTSGIERQPTGLLIGLVVTVSIALCADTIWGIVYIVMLYKRKIAFRGKKHAYVLTNKKRGRDL